MSKPRPRMWWFQPCNAARPSNHSRRHSPPSLQHAQIQSWVACSSIFELPPTSGLRASSHVAASTEQNSTVMTMAGAEASRHSSPTGPESQPTQFSSSAGQQTKYIKPSDLLRPRGLSLPPAPPATHAAPRAERPIDRDERRALVRFETFLSAQPPPLLAAQPHSHFGAPYPGQHSANTCPTRNHREPFVTSSKFAQATMFFRSASDSSFSTPHSRLRRV